MDKWRETFRKGIAPFLSPEGLAALQDALERDDERLIQVRTCRPSSTFAISLAEVEPEAACAVGYCGWQGDGLQTVGEVEEFFARACHQCDVALAEPAGCRWFLNWFDEAPRAVM